MKKEKYFWGAFFILAAFFLLVSQLGFFHDIGVIRILCTIFLLAIMIKGISRVNFPEILFPAAFIGILFDEQLHITAITPWTLLAAALLLSIGLSMIFHKHHDKYFTMYGSKHKHVDWEDVGGTESYEHVDNGANDSSVYLHRTFGSAIKYVNTKDFRYANLECNFGGMKVYFDNAVILNNNATVELELNFGGIELYIPKHWTVLNRAEVVFGGMDEKNRSQSTGSPVLTITGDVNFGGVTIIYV